MSMCLDDRENGQALEEVRQFLVEQEATFSNYRMDENITVAFKKLDLWSIPAVLIYGGEGQLRYRLTGDDSNRQFSEEDVKEAIQILRQEQAFSDQYRQ